MLIFLIKKRNIYLKCSIYILRGSWCKLNVRDKLYIREDIKESWFLIICIEYRFISAYSMFVYLNSIVKKNDLTIYLFSHQTIKFWGVFLQFISEDLILNEASRRIITRNKVTFAIDNCKRLELDRTNLK